MKRSWPNLENRNSHAESQGSRLKASHHCARSHSYAMGGMTPLKQPPKSKEDEQDLGMGQKYVKSSGFAAKEGGFDASKPDAGVSPPIHAL